MENQTNTVFEVGKFYLCRTLPVYPGSQVKYTPHLVVRKTKKKIVFERLLKSFDGRIRKDQDSFHLDHYRDGSETACKTDRWSMIPTIRPDKPCEKPAIWDTVGDGNAEAKDNK